MKAVRASNARARARAQSARRSAVDQEAGCHFVGRVEKPRASGRDLRALQYYLC